MSEYANLKSRIDAREIIILDGAIGTQLQSMGVPMDQTAWASAAFGNPSVYHQTDARELHSGRCRCHHHQHLPGPHGTTLNRWDWATK